jgi:RNA polymerase sigma-70 factor (ECF subfamily)
MTPLPDTRYSLIARLAGQEDGVAWGEFIRTYQTGIYRYCRAQGLQEAEAADVVQEVLMLVHEVVGRWQPSGRGGSFRAWLFESARRICLQQLRERRQPGRAAGGSSVLERLQEVADHDEEGNRDEVEWQRWAFCCAAGEVERQTLPETWRAFWLTAVEGVAAPVVAEQLGLSVGSVYAAKCRVLARIRARVQE